MSRVRNQIRSSRHAFTVLEVLVSLVILSVGFAGVLTLIAAGATSHRATVNYTKATQLGASVIADVETRFVPGSRDCAYADVGPEDGNPDVLLARPGQVGARLTPQGYPQADGFSYEVRFEYPGDQEYLLDADRGMLVIVTVYWQDSAGRRSEVFHKIVFPKW